MGSASKEYHVNKSPLCWNSILPIFSGRGNQHGCRPQQLGSIPPRSHSYRKWGSGIDRLLKDLNQKWGAVLGCCVCSCCAPPHSCFCLLSTPSIPLSSHKWAACQSCSWCHGRPPPNGCSSVCLSFWALTACFAGSACLRCVDGCDSHLPFSRCSK